MAGISHYFVTVAAFASSVNCFLADSPCHFDTTAVGTAASGHVETDLTNRPTCRSGQIEWHYTYPYLLVTFGGSGLPYTACIKPNFITDGFQFYFVTDGQELLLTSHREGQDVWWCQRSNKGDNLIIKVKPITTYYVGVFDFAIH
ncbi:uncharacterized protein LOC134229522 [Saccostrea cucullata]|uniref:uncharacterized protein LOC134229522 n=1 Tax=Saccostrea cuccullata TaxID=36930 RepID=UPI002ED006E1